MNWLEDYVGEGASEQHVLRVNLVIDFGYSLALAKPNKINQLILGIFSIVLL